MPNNLTREELLQTLEEAARKITENPQGILLEELCQKLGVASFCFVAILLATPFFQPISLGPYSMLSGGIFVAIGWQLIHGKTSLVLPKKASRLHLRGKPWQKILLFCAWLVRILARWTMPRFQSWLEGKRGTQLIGWLILIGGALVAIPLANIPFNNTFPALMVFFAAIAWIERDGLAILISLLWGFLTILYFFLAGFLFYKFGTWVWSLFQ
ncbi:MAG: exopolysaccharide biosynthesis protein [Chthoniobacterales bacterium]|nr:exopolysaccharide biosynthesis protein [Chthoniobacterales bacterium]